MAEWRCVGFTIFLNPSYSWQILTTENYDAVVNDKSKDVLVMIYAPWCGKSGNTFLQKRKSEEFESSIDLKCDY